MALLAAVAFAAAPRAQGIALPITFEEGLNYELTDFGGAEQSMVVADPADATNRVVRTVRSATAECFAGTTVAEVSGFTEPIPFTADEQRMSVRVWSPEAGVLVLFKVEEVGNPGLNVETYSYTTVAGGWETMVFDFGDPKPNANPVMVGGNYNKASIFFDFQCDNVPPTALPAATRTYYWDDVTYLGSGGGGSATLDLPITFEADINYEIRDFEGTTTTLVDDPAEAGNTVAQTVRGAGAATFAGTVVADVNGLATPVPFTADATTMSMRVWSPRAGVPVRLKVEQITGGAFSETETLTTVAMMWETLVFDFSAPAPGSPPVNPAESYDKLVVFFDFNRADSPMAETFYWDDITFGGEGGGGGGGGDDIALPVTFEEGLNYELTDFGGAEQSMVVADPADATNRVVRTVRSATAECFAGTTVAEVSGFTEPIPFTADEQRMSVRVWSPEAGVLVLFKVEEVGNPGLNVETYSYTTVAGGWETMVFDFGDPKPNANPVMVGGNYNKASIFFDFQCDNVPPTALPAATRTYYWDDITFGVDTGGDTDPVVSFVSPNVTWAEGGGFATLRVRIDYDGMPDGMPVSVAIAYAGGSASAEDVTSPTPMVVTFSGNTDGEVKTATISAVGNDGDEPDETALFGLTVTAGAATVGDPGVFSFDIVDTDPLEFYTMGDARARGVGEYLSVRGVVTRTEGAFTYIQDGSGAIAVRQTSGDFFDDVADGTIRPGSYVRVTGELSEFASLLQINGSDLNSYAVSENTTTIPAAQVVTLAELAANGEAYESELVTVQEVTLGAGDNNGGTFAAATTYAISDASDASGAVSLRVPNATDTTVDGEDVPPRANITAIAGQFNFDDPTTGYQLLAIEAEDIEALPAVASETRPDGTVVSLTVPNPLRGTATVRFSAGVASDVSVALYDMLGRRVATLADGPVASGEQTATLDTSRLAAGVYVLRMQMESGSLTETVSVVR